MCMAMPERIYNPIAVMGVVDTFGHVLSLAKDNPNPVIHHAHMRDQCHLGTVRDPCECECESNQ